MTRQPTITNIRYWTDGYATYWNVADERGPIASFCSNTYATFAGDRIGERQIMGPARAPAPEKGARAMRSWLIREFGDWPGHSDKVSVRRVKDIKELA